jgi:hypothetical protein
VVTHFTDVLTAVEALMQSISNDNSRHGGLLSRDTIRACDETRLVISRLKSNPPLPDLRPEEQVTGMDYERDAGPQN